MISTRDIKRKIKTILNIQQMCRAMKTVSLVKLQKAETKLAVVRPYSEKMAKSFSRLAGFFGTGFFAEDAGETTVVITSDKGLCGGYNASVIRRAVKETEGKDVVALGRKGERFLRRMKRNITDSVTNLGSEPTFSQISPVADRLTEKLREQKTSTINAVHAHFISGTRSEVIKEEIFPIMDEAGGNIIIEPDPNTVAEVLLQRHVRAALYAAVLESSASEHGARVAAMSAATENADKMIDELTMDYNRARQSMITKELSEIVGSAEALN